MEKFSINNEKQAKEIVDALTKQNFLVQEVQTKETKRKPYAPFTTSTLQQEASSKLYFSPKRTMQVAQGLYEGVSINGETKGLITYMRTDSISISNEGINDIRKYIEKDLGIKYLPEKPIFYASKQKNAQEAHEAIRPTDASITPEKAKKFLKDEQFKLYDLIWRRAVASQIENAVFEATKVLIGVKNHQFKTSGSIIKFDGFLKIYNFASSEENLLPQMNEGDTTKMLELMSNQHFTQAPARYTEATLIKQLEERGIGRPSTYASIISVIQERGYVKMNEQKRLQPEFRGRVVNSFLEKFFSKYVEYDFTAKLEESLDSIAEGKNTKIKFLESFWKPFKHNVDEAMQKQYEDVVKSLNEDLASIVFKTDENGVLQNNCPSCKSGILSLKLGKFGLFGSCSNYPECKYILNPDGQEQSSQPITTEGKHLGDYANKKYFLKQGPYGLYIEVLEEGTKKPKRLAIPKQIDSDSVDITLAQKLEDLPRVIGKHPEDNLAVSVGIGPYGPYLLHNKKYTSLKNVQDVFEISLEDACQKIAENLAKPKRVVRKTSTKKKA
jgi:DNA topoisomerase-1